MYTRAMAAGAVGGKLLGTGGGGFMLFFVEPEKRATFSKAMHDCLEIPIKFDFDGSKIVVYQPNY